MHGCGKRGVAWRLRQLACRLGEILRSGGRALLPCDQGRARLTRYYS